MDVRLTKNQSKAIRACTQSCVNRAVWFKYKGEPGRYQVGTIEDVVSILDGEYNHLIQRIKLTPKVARNWKAKHAYRLGYYTLSAKARRPVWGQFHSLIPAADFRRLVRKADSKGWL